MNWLEKTWKWLDGKKTAIGFLLVTAAPYTGKYSVILETAGIILGGTGIAHKGVKSRVKK